jgi:methylated-DNA-protein-cysteine methyltransferase-like protein
MDDLLIEHVLVAVEQIPRGRVASYGDLAILVGIGPRQVGSVMSRWGGNVTWWRVTNSSGDLPAHLHTEAARHWATEGIEWKPNRLGCRIAVYRADLLRLAQDYERAVAHLPALPAAGT